MTQEQQGMGHGQTFKLSTQPLGRETPAAGFPPDGNLEDEPVPEALGPYRVLGLLGRGNMGDVFLAYDPALARTLAIKRIRPDRLEAAGVERRFAIEARVTSMLQHPCIVPVYQLFQEGEALYYTMRPIAGNTLGAILDDLRRNRPGAREEWPASRLVRLFLQAAGAVAYAHSRGVIHRDLKPQNIMIGPFEEVLVLDWGMAKVLADTAEPEAGAGLPPLSWLTTETGGRAVIGSPAYMAPQQLAGAPADVASDVFSLGAVLYELLTLRLPWEGDTLTALYQARRQLPVLPTRLQPGHGIPHDLAGAALRALAFEPEKRFPSVIDFTREVASALEGRAPWRLDEPSREASNWSFAGGELEREGGDLVLRSGGGILRYFCVRPFGDNVRVEFEVSTQKGHHELSVWLNSPEPHPSRGRGGYQLMALPGGRRTLSLLRAGRIVAGAASPEFKPREWYAVTATREDDRFSLAVNGETVYVYHDPIPLSGGFVGLSGQSSGLRLRGLRINSRGTAATVSCLAVPDALFNRRLYPEARAEYGVIAASHPGRNEGRLAAFRAGLCLVELARLESAGNPRAPRLEEAREAFARLAGGGNDSCLVPLGEAMVAAAQADPAGESAHLSRAFEAYPGDASLPAAREWLLGRLHAAASDERRTVAELMPLGIAHCMEGWSGRAVRQIMQRLHNRWEIPSFMTCRGQFRPRDRTSHALAALFFGFWTARPERIQRAVEELAAWNRLRPQHLADGVFSLLEIGHGRRAADLLTAGTRWLRQADDPRQVRILGLLGSSVTAALGDVDEAERLLRSQEPDPSDRVYNSARLQLARAAFERGAPSRTFAVLEPLGPEERFAAEYQAWFHLWQGDAGAAKERLAGLVARGEHRTGRSLCNFLHGVTLILEEREEEAARVFRQLPGIPWPRTWTLGSHYAAGRLGDGDLGAYLAGAFPFEKKNLRAHAELLARARKLPPCAIPLALRDPGDLEAARPQEGPAPRRTGEPGPRS